MGVKHKDGGLVPRWDVPDNDTLVMITRKKLPNPNSFTLGRYIVEIPIKQTPSIGKREGIVEVTWTTKKRMVRNFCGIVPTYVWILVSLKII